MTLALATNLMFLASVSILGGLSIVQAWKGDFGSVAITNLVMAAVIAMQV